MPRRLRASGRAVHPRLLARPAADDPDGVAAAGADAHADLGASRRPDHRRRGRLFRRRSRSPARPAAAARAALRTMLKRLAAGDCVGITPDGPRGPAMAASDRHRQRRPARAGADRADHLSPPAAAGSLRTWDRFHLALPFGRGVFLWGEPIEIAADLDEAGDRTHARRLIEQRMSEMVREADRRVGIGRRSRAGAGRRPPVPGTQAAPPGLSASEKRPRSCPTLVMLPLLYRALTAPLTPLVYLLPAPALPRGKEDGARFAERLGVAGGPAPDGPLVWVHAASVGEATSVLALIERLLASGRGLEILITTGTVAAARLLRTRLPARRAAPIRAGRSAARGRAVSRPLAARSGALGRIRAVAQPGAGDRSAAASRCCCSTAGLSARSLSRAGGAGRGWSRPMLGAFALCLAQDEVQARAVAPARRRARWRASATSRRPANRCRPTRRDRGAGAGRSAVRPLWLAASTHAGEEEIAAAAHRRLARGASRPADDHRAAPSGARRRDRRDARRRADCASPGASRGEPIDAETDIYLADTFGELGLFYRLAGIAFIGGSLVDEGRPQPVRGGAARLRHPARPGHEPIARRWPAALAAAGAAQTVVDAARASPARCRGCSTTRRLRAERAPSAARASPPAASACSMPCWTRLAPWLDPARAGGNGRDRRAIARAAPMSCALMRAP